MGYNKKLTAEDLEEMRKMLERGCGYQQCSDFFGNILSRQRIKQYAQRWGIDAKRIQTEKLSELKNKQMSEKWGTKWKDQEWRKSDIYKSMREKFRNKKANAKNKGIEFTVPFGELDFPEHCPVLGIPIDYFVEGSADDSSPSFDRIDSSKGYVSGNVVIVSWRANRLKNNGTPEEHLKIAQFYSR